jgi:peptidoglycan/LPS O-acetylase OafA/YrhL
MGTSIGAESKTVTKTATWRLPAWWPAWWPARSWWWPESGARSPIPALDGVRTLAVLLVMFFHAWWVMPERSALGVGATDQPIYYLWTGVHLFFVLSGFLLFLPYARWIQAGRDRPSALLFYKRRFLRIVPAYWASLVILTLAGPKTGGSFLDTLAHAVFLQNLSEKTVYSINGVFWTMAVEVQFYAVLPLLALALYLLARRVKMWPALAVFVAALVLISAATVWLQSVPRLAANSLIYNVALRPEALTYWINIFGFGIACSMIYVAIQRNDQILSFFKDRWSKWSVERVATWGFALAALFWLALTFIPALHPTPWNDIGFGLTYALALLGILLGRQLIRRPFEWRPVRFVGLISYSLYIWHLVIMRLAEPLLLAINATPRVGVGFLIECIVGIPVAYASYMLFERPFIAARRRAHGTVNAPQA